MAEVWDERDDARGKRDRLARFFRVILVLQANSSETTGISAEEIGRIVGVSRRTAYRDLAVIEHELGFPIWNERGRFGLLKSALLPALRFSREEAMAVFLSARLVARHADEYDPDLGAAFQKLAEAVPPTLRDHVTRTVGLMAKQATDAAQTTRVHDLTRAWAERRVVEFVYDTSTYGRAEPQRRARVRPYLIEPSLLTRALYLIGLDEMKGELRTFKIERIRELVVTPGTFDSDPEVAIEDRLAAAWDIIADQPLVDVRLRFAPAVASRVAESRWHPSQVIGREADGSLSWSGRVSGTHEIRIWILSWGADVEVLEPAALRADVAATLERALASYRGR